LNETKTLAEWRRFVKPIPAGVAAALTSFWAEHPGAFFSRKSYLYDFRAGMRSRRIPLALREVKDVNKTAEAPAGGPAPW
jgi:hypothetical protein